jgi:hypothetical protein
LGKTFLKAVSKKAQCYKHFSGCNVLMFVIS